MCRLCKSCFVFRRSDECCTAGEEFADVMARYAVKGKDGNFYSTRLTRSGTPVRLEVPHEQRSLLYGALWLWNLEPSIVRYIGRRVEQYRHYAIVVIDKIVYN